MRRYLPLVGSVVSSIISLILIVLMFRAFPVQPLAAQVDVSNYSNVRADGFIRADTYLRAGTYVQAGTYAQVGTFLQVDAATHITYTSGALTPLGSNQPVCVAANRGLTNVTVLAAGTLVSFVNNCAATVGFTDTLPLVLGGNRVLGQYDRLVLQSDGTRWIEYSFANN